MKMSKNLKSWCDHDKNSSEQIKLQKFKSLSMATRATTKGSDLNS